MSALTQQLETQITDALKRLQQRGGHEAVKEQLLDLLNPDEAPYLTMSQALARMDAAHAEIKTAIDSGRTYPWISARLAAIAFEGVFECCLAAWLAAGKPDDPLELKPGVQQFVNWQMRMFAVTIGAR